MVPKPTTLERLVAADRESEARREVQRIVANAGSDATLESLGALAADGSKLATELLLEVLDDSGIVRRFVGSYLLDESAVDDVAQDTLISVATSIASFRGDARFTTWLFRLARNRAIDHLRRVRPDVVVDEGNVGPAQRISSMIANRSTIRDLLSGLPDHYRRAVTRRDVEGMSYAAIADDLGLNVNTVKSHIARGRAMVAANASDEQLP